MMAIINWQNVGHKINQYTSSLEVTFNSLAKPVKIIQLSTLSYIQTSSIYK